MAEQPGRIARCGCGRHRPVLGRYTRVDGASRLLRRTKRFDDPDGHRGLLSVCRHVRVRRPHLALSRCLTLNRFSAMWSTEVSQTRMGDSPFLEPAARYRRAWSCRRCRLGSTGVTVGAAWMIVLLTSSLWLSVPVAAQNGDRLPQSVADDGSEPRAASPYAVHLPVAVRRTWLRDGTGGAPSPKPTMSGPAAHEPAQEVYAGCLERQATDIRSDGVVDQVWLTRYDDLGRRVVRQFDSDGDGEVDAIYGGYYDPHDDLSISFGDHDADGVPDVVSYSYFERGALVRVETDEGYDGGIDSVERYIYDTRGYLARQVFDDDGDGVADEVWWYEYDFTQSIYPVREFVDRDADGLAEAVYKYTWQDGVMVQWEWDLAVDGVADTILVMTYDSVGRLSRIDSYGGDFMVRGWEEFRYGDDGWLAEQIDYRGGRPHQRTTVHRDEAGRPVKSIGQGSYPITVVYDRECPIAANP